MAVYCIDTEAQEGKTMSEANDWCDPTEMDTWSDAEICDFYDQNPNLTNLQYARQLGITCAELNEILMDSAKS